MFIDNLLYLFVFAGGAAGLIYEVTWQRYLSRLLGSDTIATAIILSAFLGGISLGYYLCGRLTLRVKNHFKAYALLEGIVGVWGLSFPAIFIWVDSFSRQWTFSPPFKIILQGLICSVILMGIPTICMGGTIPFLTRALSKNIRESTGVLSRIYAINTAGAFIGTLLAGFYLIPQFGLPLSVMTTAFLNLGACIFFYLLSIQRKQLIPFEMSERDITTVVREDLSISPRFPFYILYAIVFLNGIYLMSLENVLIRITNLSLGGSSYTFSMIVSVFIFSIAIGSYIVGKLKTLPRYLLFINQLLITLSLLLLYFSLDTWPYWAHIIRIAFQSNMIGFWTYHLGIFSALTFVLIIPVTLMGATTPIAFHELKRTLKNVGRHSGILFSWNTIGNLLGSLVGGIILYYFLNNAGVFLAAVLLAAISTGLIAWYLSRKYFLLASLLAMTVFISIFYTPYYTEKNFMLGTFRLRNQLSFSLKGPHIFFEKFFGKNQLKFYEDGPNCSVGVIEGDYSPLLGQRAMEIVVNGKSDSSTLVDISTLKLLAHIPALLAGKRRNILVIGLGTGVTAGELTLYPDIEQIDIAEISPSVVKALPYFAEASYNLHKNSKVRIHMGDAFRILGRSEKKWDIIISEPSNPWVTGVDLLFTQEFYKLVKEHLTEEGVLLQWMHVYSASPLMVGMIVNTVQQEFKQSHVFMAHPGDLLIFASKRSLSIENMETAENTLNRFNQVKASLEVIDIKSLDSILIREIWTPSYISDCFSGFGFQTMDNPRLHYIAGKDFFIGKSVSHSFLFGSQSVKYLQEYLMVKKYNNWQDISFPKDTWDSLLLAVTEKTNKVQLPMASALKLKAHLSAPSLFPFNEKEEFDAVLIPFIVDSRQDEKAWEKIGCKGFSFRQKAELLIRHVNIFRNWIVPYPVEGLKALLKEGIQNGKDAREKEWCSHQLELLLMH